MISISRKQLKNWMMFIAALSVGIFCRAMDENRSVPAASALGAVQTLVYSGMIAFWGVSIHKRVVQREVRKLTEGICMLLVLWFLLRGTKYYVMPLFDDPPAACRYLWYSYYIPMLFVPVLFLLAARCIGEPETYVLPKRLSALLLAVSMLLFLGVITNDLHQLAFSFPADTMLAYYSDKEYAHNILYYLVALWMAGCVLTALVMMFKKCRLPDRKFIWLPLLPFVFAICYTIYYILNIMDIFRDITVVLSCTMAVLCEMSIVTGLIRSNTSYAELFYASGLSAVITDRSFSVVYKSARGLETDGALLKTAVQKGHVTAGGRRLCSSAIHNGYVFWQEDVTALLETKEALEGTRQELRSYGSLLEEENKQKKRRKKLKEQQLLYEAVRQKTEEQQRKLSKLAQQLQEAETLQQAGKLLYKMTVIGAYVKRRSNLTLLSHKTGKVSALEPELCIRESMTYLTQAGVICAVQFDVSDEVSAGSAGLLYDFFEAAVESSFDSLKIITVIAACEQKLLYIRIILQCACDMSGLSQQFPEAVTEYEDGIWFCSLAVKKEGEDV